MPKFRGADVAVFENALGACVHHLEITRAFSRRNATFVAYGLKYNAPQHASQSGRPKGTADQYMASQSFTQRTLKRPVACEGVGLHSGASVNLQILPASADHGISFVRTGDSMAQNFSRRYFFYGSLLAGAIPKGGT